MPRNETQLDFACSGFIKQHSRSKPWTEKKYPANSQKFGQNQNFSNSDKKMFGQNQKFSGFEKKLDLVLQRKISKFRKTIKVADENTFLEVTTFLGEKSKNHRQIQSQNFVFGLHPKLEQNFFLYL